MASLLFLAPGVVPNSRPAKLHADKGYDYPRCRRSSRDRGIKPRIARRGIEPKDRLGDTVGWLNVPMLGATSSAGFGSAMSTGPTFT